MKRFNLFFVFITLLGLLNTSCKKEEKEEDVVAPVLLPVASFAVSVGSGNTPLSVTFTNNSTNATKYEWDFGDGSSSTESAPSHIFNNTSITSAKTFVVTLRAFDANNATNTTTKTISVEPAKKQLTKSEMLTAGPWIITGLVEKDAFGEVDVFLVQQKCVKDNIYIFKTNGTYVEEEGKDRCNATDPTVVANSAGIWSLNSQDELLLDNEEVEFVTPLTATSVKIQIRVVDTNGSVYFEIITLKRT